jgi:hypothetical protein
VPEEKLGEFYAQRTLLKREVLPEQVAAAVFALVGGDLALTTDDCLRIGHDPRSSSRAGLGARLAPSRDPQIRA